MSAPKLYTDAELRDRKAARQAAYRAQQGDHVREIEREYREKNRGAAAIWRSANKDIQRAYFKERYAKEKAAGVRSSPAAKTRAARYYDNNKARIGARHRAYKKANPEIVRNQSRKRRALAGGSLSADIESRLFKQQRGRCANCTEKLERFDLDHIVPLSRGGRNEDLNAQLLCPTCNRRKHAKDPIAFAQEQGRLL